MDKFAVLQMLQMLQMLKLKNSMMVKEEKNRYTDFLFFLRQKRKEVKGK